MLSLSVDVTEWISKGLKKSSKEVLKHRKELSKHLDDLVEKKKITAKQKVKVLEELAEVGDFAKFSKNIDSVKLTKIDLKLWKYIIETKGGRLRFFSESDEILKLQREYKFDAMFRATDIPPTIWIKNPPTDLELFHETMHFEDYLKRGKEKYLKGSKRKLKSGKIIIPTKRDELIASYLREKYVLDKVLEEQANWIKKYGKGRFTDDEIFESQLYFNKKYKEPLLIAKIDITKLK